MLLYWAITDDRLSFAKISKSKIDGGDSNDVLSGTIEVSEGDPVYCQYQYGENEGYTITTNPNCGDDEPVLLRLDEWIEI